MGVPILAFDGGTHQEQAVRASPVRAALECNLLAVLAGADYVEVFGGRVPSTVQGAVSTS